MPRAIASPNVGEAMKRDFERMGFEQPSELAKQDAFALYQRMCKVSGVRQDPCVLDTYLAVVDFMNGGKPRPWWDFTKKRKQLYPDI